MKKKYVVILQNVTWNNLFYIGEYEKLEDAIPEIKNNLPDEYEIDELVEYPSTLGMCFDKELYNPQDEDDEVYMIRGFILEEE